MSFLNDLVVRIRGDKSSLDSTISSAERIIENFAKKTTAWLKGAFAIGSIVAFGKAIIDASARMSNEFSFAIAGVKEATEHFFRAIANGDFSNLISGLEESYKRARDLAQKMHELQELKAYDDYINTQLKARSTELQEITKNQELPKDERLNAGRERVNIEKQILERSKRLNETFFAIEKQQWEERNKNLEVTADQAVEIYKKMTEIPDWELTRLQSEFQKRQKYGKIDFYRGTHVIGVSDESVDTYQKYWDLANKGEKDVIEKLFAVYKEYSENKIDAQLRYNTVLRETSRIANQVKLQDKESNDEALKKIKLSEKIKEEIHDAYLPGTLANPINPKDVNLLSSMYKTSSGSHKAVDVYSQTWDMGKEEKDVISDVTNGLLTQQEAVRGLRDEFDVLFTDGSKGFDRMVNDMIRSIERLVSEIIAKKVIQLLVSIIGNYLEPGLGSLGSKAVGQIGTPTLATPVNTNQLAPMKLQGNAGMNGEFKLKGTDLYLSVQRSGALINGNT